MPEAQAERLPLDATLRRLKRSAALCDPAPAPTAVDRPDLPAEQLSRGMALFEAAWQQVWHTASLDEAARAAVDEALGLREPAADTPHGPDKGAPWPDLNDLLRIALDHAPAAGSDALVGFWGEHAAEVRLSRPSHRAVVKAWIAESARHTHPGEDRSPLMCRYKDAPRPTPSESRAWVAWSQAPLQLCAVREVAAGETAWVQPLWVTGARWWPTTDQPTPLVAPVWADLAYSRAPEVTAGDWLWTRFLPEPGSGRAVAFCPVVLPRVAVQRLRGDAALLRWAVTTPWRALRPSTSDADLSRIVGPSLLRLVSHWAA